MANHGIVIKSIGKADLTETSIPQLRDDYLAVKVCAVAINPTDWKHIDVLGSHAGYPNATVGCDYAGVVEEVGSRVRKDFKKGDRVCGLCHGSNSLHHESGAFQEHIVAKGDVQIIIPDNLTFEQAATLGVGVSTVGQGLYQSLQLPMPDKPPPSKFPLLIYGGSTATGSLAIQFAKLSGLEVIVTCSPHSFEYVKKLGADAAFDYKDQNCSHEIKKYTKHNLRHVFDCVSAGNSTEISVNSMSSKGGIYSTLDPISQEKVSAINSKVEVRSTIAYTILGEGMSLGGTDIAPKAEDFQFAQSFWDMARVLLADGKLMVHRPSINEGGEGLRGALKGLQAGREGRISGRKLVYSL